MKQSPIRKLRRDRSRLVQDLALANAGGGDRVKASEIEGRIAELDKEIAAIVAARGDGE
jgi:hypothetical protein